MGMRSGKYLKSNTLKIAWCCQYYRAGMNVKCLIRKSRDENEIDSDIQVIGSYG